MSVSIVIPSYNGAHKVGNILRALENQTYKEFEVIVMVDGSTDNTLEVLQNSTFHLPKLTVHYQENGGRSVARNSGAKLAKGDILVFFDDDMRPQPTCVGEHVAHHLRIKNSIMVGGIFEDPTLLKTDIQQYKFYLSQTWFEPLAKLERPLGKKELYLAAANASLRKSLFFDLGGFDEQITDAEDFDLGVIAYLNHIPIYYRENAHGWHDDFVTCRSMIIRQRQYRKAHASLKKLKPEVYKEFNQHQPAPVGSFKKMIYWLFSFRQWVYVIDCYNWLLILPKNLRYKIYDFTITSLSVHFPEVKV